MARNKCKKCGEFVRGPVFSHDPATGITKITEIPLHFCGKTRATNGRFARRSTIEKMRPYQMLFNLKMSQLYHGKT